MSGIESGNVLDLSVLSPAESQVLDVAIQGLSVRDIAQRLSLTEATIRSHLSAIYAKLGVSGRVELLARMNGAAPQHQTQYAGDRAQPEPQVAGDRPAPPVVSHPVLLTGGIAAGIAASALIVALVVGLIATVGPSLGMELKIINDSGGLVRGVDHDWFGPPWVSGSDEFRVHMAPGVADSQGQYVACRIVRPALEGSQFESTHFKVYDWSWKLVADDRTLCS
jgi:DNA-binding CsgD family transcriptional regulator